MSVVSITTAKKAKKGGEACFGKAKASSSLFSQIIEIIGAAWPKKTAACVAHLTGVSERAVQFWLSEQTRMSVEHAAALLRTDAGYDILKAIMGDSKVEWWLVTQAAQNVRKSKKAIRREEERIAQVKAQLSLLDQ